MADRGPGLADFVHLGDGQERARTGALEINKWSAAQKKVQRVASATAPAPGAVCETHSASATMAATTLTAATATVAATADGIAANAVASSEAA
eukprot:4862821-Prymnesium_polylepis.1